MSTLREALIKAAASGLDEYYETTPPDFADDPIKHACIADAALSAFRQWLEAEGLVCAPAQPTHEMQFAGGTCKGGTEHEGEGEADTIVFPAVIYRAMIAAAPDALAGEK